MTAIRMQRATILVLKDDAPRCTRALIDFGFFHPSVTVKDHVQEISFTALEYSQFVAAYAQLEHDLLEVLNRLGISPPEEDIGETDPVRDLSHLQQVVSDITALVTRHDQELAQVHTQVLRIEQASLARKSLAARHVVWEHLARAERLQIQLGWIPGNLVEHLKEALGTLTHVLQTLAFLGQQALILVITLPQDGTHVNGVLLGSGFRAQVYADKAPHEQIDENRIGELHEKERRLNDELTAIKRRWTDRLLEAIRRARKNRLILENSSCGLAAGPAVLFQGWIPEPDSHTLRELLESATSGRFWMTLAPAEVVATAADEKESVPILHRNPLLLKPFQQLVEAYGEPSYGEVDPTPIFALSFIFMFGMMFGDTGQGAILAAIGYGLFRYLPGRQDFGVLLMECGASSMVFGILYGNVFGIEHAIIPHLWFHPMKNVMFFLKITLIFGIGMITIGFVINIIDAFRRKAYPEMIFGKNGLAAAFVYWILAGLAIRYLLARQPVLAINHWVMGIVFLLMVLLLVHQPIIRGIQGQRPIFPRPILLHLFESTIEMVDTVTRYATNTISFLRVAAFSLMHVALFMVIFTIANLLAQGATGQVGYWLTVIFGNIVVIVVEGLLVSIQILRLEYYEFFSKFYSGEGREFRPLGGRLAQQ